jgi:hypothetical protein
MLRDIFKISLVKTIRKKHSARLEIDHTRHRFPYGIDEHALPAKNLVGTVEVRAFSNGTPEVSRASEFDCDAAQK